MNTQYKIKFFKVHKLSDARLQAGKLTGLKGAIKNFDFDVHSYSNKSQKVYILAVPFVQLIIIRPSSI